MDDADESEYDMAERLAKDEKLSKKLEWEIVVLLIVLFENSRPCCSFY